MKMPQSLLKIILCSQILRCVSANETQFYHPEFGTVDGNNEQLMQAGKDCVMQYQARHPQHAEEHPVDEESSDAATLMLTPELAMMLHMYMVADITDKAKVANQEITGCMTQKQWQRIK